MFNLQINYPTNEEEISIVRQTTKSIENTLSPVLEKLDIKNYQNLVRRVPVADNVVEYAVKLVSATRPGSKNAPNFIKDSISWGSRPSSISILNSWLQS